MSRAFPPFAAAVLAVCIAATIAACAPAAPEPRPTATSQLPAPTTTPVPTTPPTPATPPEMPTADQFDTAALSIDDPASLWVVVNKLRPLNPRDFQAPDLVTVPVPYANEPRLRAEAAAAAAAMFAAFANETGLALQAQSAYRSYATQVEVYNGWVARKGQAGADLTSARPGHSEHQTGLAIDISSLPAECTLAACFGDTAHGKWLAANSWSYGFVLRYPSGKTAITGYEYEPWHFRYTGVALAAELHATGTATLEEFFGLPPAPTYAG